jgi:ferredoxin
VVYKISDDCISCGVCVEECPAEAISEGADKYEIDPEKCTSCGNCSEICPVGAPQEQE